MKLTHRLAAFLLGVALLGWCAGPQLSYESVHLRPSMEAFE